MGKQHLVLVAFCNQPVNGNVSAPNLKVSFNQPIDGVAWPGTLQQLTFAVETNHPICNLSQVPKLTLNIESAKILKLLAFGRHFNQAIAGVVWPASLRQVKFNDAWNRLVQGVTCDVIFTGRRIFVSA